MGVDRLLPNDEAYELVGLVSEIAQAELAPRAAETEAIGRFPREIFALLGEAGVLGLPYAQEWGGAEQPYEVYLQALEEIAAAWMSVAVGVSVHVMTCYPLVVYGSAEQQNRFLPEMVGGSLLGAYALSEAQAGSDIASMSTRAECTPDGYQLKGAKAWITHAGQADFYTTFARTGEDAKHGASCFLVSANADGLSFGAPEQKMGLMGSTTASVYLDHVEVAPIRRIGAEGEGLHIALAALDSGRLGIAACATGLAQAALDCASEYAKTRQQFGRSIADFQGMQFLLADMAAAVDSSRAAYLLAARKRDAGRPFSRDAAVAKLIATDMAMKVTPMPYRCWAVTATPRTFRRSAICGRPR